MAQEQQELRGVNWNEVFSFTQIFKSFRMAIHPSKLALASMALVVVLLSMLILDLVWGVGGQYVQNQEIPAHATMAGADFRQIKSQWQDNRLRVAAEIKAFSDNERQTLSRYQDLYVEAANLRGLDPAPFRQTIRQAASDQPTRANAKTLFEEAVQRRDSVSKVLGEANNFLDEETATIKRLIRDARGETADAAEQALAARRLEFQQAIQTVRGQRVGEAFVAYQRNCLVGAVEAVANLNFVGNLNRYNDLLQRRMPGPVAIDPLSLQVPSLDAPRRPQAFDIQIQNLPQQVDARGPGLVLWVLMSYRGFVWLIAQHWVYAVVFFVITLAVVALFGGAINRIAALHFAREEKISVFQALRFAIAKFLSFFTAPLIPIGVMFAIGALLVLSGLLLNIPYVGEIIVGILFFLSILGGLAIAFLTVGLIGGSPLMYPTIAVEGSDAFDAISRSYNYVYARPWRAIVYGAVAAVYGVITYLFVRLFAFVALQSTHMFVKWGVWSDGQSIAPGADKVDVIWAEPTFWSFMGPFNWAAMTAGRHYIGALLVNFWVFLVAVVVVAYLISYAASASTVIYYLLRRKVDATDLDDVYVEEPSEEQPANDTGASEQTPAQQASEPEEPAKPQEETPKEDQPPASDSQ